MSTVTETRIPVAIPSQRTARPFEQLPAPAHDLPKLTRHQLRSEQQRTLDAPRRRYSLAARLLFVGMDLMYGRKRTLSKFRVLEIVARVPYQTWETVTYKQITNRAPQPARHPSAVGPRPRVPCPAGQRAVAPADPR